MSFYDVAGLVLAVLPVVCQGLEAYPDSFFAKLILVKNHLKIFVFQLQTMEAGLRTAMIAAFRRMEVALTTDQMEVLKSPNVRVSKFFVLWNELLEENGDAIACSFESSLAEAKDALNDMARILAEITRGTPVPNDAEPEVLREFINNENEKITFFKSKDFRRRFEFARSIHKRRELLGRMEKNIERLNLLNKREDILKGIPIRRKRSEIDSAHRSFLDNVRKYCDTLYHALRDAWRCECHKSPSAMLRLEKRVTPESNTLRFSLFLRYEHMPSTDGQNCWSYQHAEVSVYERKTRFDDEPPEIDYRQALPPVRNICESLSCSHAEQRGRLEFILDQERKLFEFESENEITRIKIQQNCLSLEDRILPQSGPHRFVNPSKRERLSLAVNLAYSVLQLHTTPWLPETWGTKSIYLPVDLQQPHVLIRFDEPTRPFENPVDVLNPYLVALGIVLLELWEWKSFQQWRKEATHVTFPAENIIDVSRAAMIWLEEREGERKMSPAYANVVRCCLKCSFDSIQRTLTDEEFQYAVYCDIVQTLDSVYHVFTNPCRQ